MVQDKTLGMRIFRVFLVLFFSMVVIVCVFPFFYMFSLSTSGMSALMNNRVRFVPVDFNVQAYLRIFDFPGFFRGYLNTIFYTTAGTFISLTLSLMFAYPLSKNFLYGRKIIIRLIIFSMFFTGGLVPNFLLIRSLNLANTVWAMLVPFAIQQFNLIILINFLRGIPEEIEEAAIIDGMGYFGILTRIVVPLSKPAIATVGLYTAVFFWNDWFNALLYLNTQQQPVMRVLRNIVIGAVMAGDASGFGDRVVAEMASRSAVILVSVIPIIVLYPFLQRFFVKGLTVGSLKG
jgi:putative aldouronate transport system permease protein